jgi:hypothetical protein
MKMEYCTKLVYNEGVMVKIILGKIISDNGKYTCILTGRNLKYTIRNDNILVRAETNELFKIGH